jgi:hypothetical protein
MAETRRRVDVVNVSELEVRTIGVGTKFGASMKHLGFATASRGIGCTWYEVPPGRAAFATSTAPTRSRCSCSKGQARSGSAATRSRCAQGTTSLPIGPNFSHQLRNSGSEPLRYLCFSTLSTAEVVGYPDSKKIGAMAAPSMEAALKGEHWVRILAFEPSKVGYYDGEDAG